jgi:hypothetical protein
MPLHRAIGKSSLLLFPFLIGGLFAIIDVTASNFAAGRGPVTMMFGGSFLLGLLVAVAAYVLLYYRALKYRRKVWLHSGYMLGTPLILWESPFSRLLNGFVPGLTIRVQRTFIASFRQSNGRWLPRCSSASSYGGGWGSERTRSRSPEY